MNTCVQAGPLVISVVAIITETKVLTSSVVMVVINDVNSTCLHTSKLSINGHSISAINPDNFYVGGQAMPIAA